ncbi:YbaB/EbfC family nucleoid-associated protein [Nocardia carnea]|uniref:YbaB/EbfC family nucleoid-associated protein n=1 Tax=Nocardia carnea TaxID=37328 RepID=A0ABW7TN75_9NOCA|nr:YbaB/EbfC family nucleoid-associated protein [Nocardia carnea]
MAAQFAGVRGEQVNTSDRAAEIARINAELAEIRGSIRSRDGSVLIETDVAGRITKIWLADYAMDDGPDHLATVIADTHRLALAEAMATAERTFNGTGERATTEQNHVR